jgi:hypothetical protein
MTLPFPIRESVSEAQFVEEGGREKSTEGEEREG